MDFLLYILICQSILLLVVLLVLFLRTRKPGAVLPRIEARLNTLDNLSREMGELSKIFLLPKIRGGIGETLLEELLANWLPRRSYEYQYNFRNGTRADAVIHIGGYLVAIDSKFPITEVLRSVDEGSHELSAGERRSLIKYTKDIAEKYIQPEEGTLQFALMYIPSEAIYYRSFIEGDPGLMNEIIRLGVVPVSPSGLFLYLQTIAYGLRGFAFHGRQREFLKIISQLKKDFRDLEKGYNLIGTHIRNLRRSYDETSGPLQRVNSAIPRIESPEEDE